MKRIKILLVAFFLLFYISEIKALSTNVVDFKKLGSINITLLEKEDNIKIEGAEITLYKIANQYGVTVAEIMELNNLGTTVLTVGEQILIPNKGQDTTTTYTVQSGDSLYSIAKKFNTSVDSLKKKNGLGSTMLSIGQVLKI